MDRSLKQCAAHQQSSVKIDLCKPIELYGREIVEGERIRACLGATHLDQSFQ